LFSNFALELDLQFNKHFLELS